MFLLCCLVPAPQASPGLLAALAAPWAAHASGPRPLAA
jgi:hypothetical protein